MIFRVLRLHIYYDFMLMTNSPLSRSAPKLQYFNIRIPY